jgi:hypothetical protein
LCEILLSLHDIDELNAKKETGETPADGDAGMTHAVRDTAGAEMNRYWRAQQATQQKPAKDVHHGNAATDKQPVILPDTPKSTGETPGECVKCTVAKKCKIVLKMWYQHAPRPELVRAWCQFIDQSAGDMVCLSKMQAPQDIRFSLRRDK